MMERSKSGSTTLVGGLRERLKAITAEEHRITEEVMYSDRIMNGELTLDRYKHLLRTHFVFHSALEKAIAEHSSFFSAMRPADRKKAQHFRADLLRLNGPIPAEQDLFTGWDAAELLGAVYVAEGSTLGGAVIARALKKNGLADAAGIEIGSFGSYGERTGERWKEFLDFLENNAGAADAACDGAVRAFRLLRDVFAGME